MAEAPANEAPAASAAEADVGLTFEEIYETFFPFIWRNLRRLGVPESNLRDAAQDVFVVVHRRLPEFAGRSSLRSWLYGIVVRIAHDQRRTWRRKGLVSVAEPDALSSDHGDDPQQRLERARAMRLVFELCAELDERKREVFLLSELEDMSVPEIAAAIGVNVNTVYSRLRAARQEFEQALARRRSERRQS